jgi:spore coat protein U-like protein
MKSSIPSFLLLLRLIVGSSVIVVNATAVITPNSTTPIATEEEEAMSRIIIQFKAGKKTSVLNKVGLNGDTTTSLFTNNNGSKKNKNKKHYEFNNLNTLAVTVPTSTVEALKADPNIVHVEIDPIRYLIPTTLSSTIGLSNTNNNKTKTKLRRVLQGGQTVPYGIDMVEARDVWDTNRDGSIDSTGSGVPSPTGANRKVCIIDSGFHATHEDLQGISVSGYEGVASLPWNEDQNSHGTHVAGALCVFQLFS